MFIDTAAWAELAQLLLALSGVALAFWRLWVAIENGLVITTAESTDLRRIVAETQVLGELFRLFAQGLLVAVGIVSVLLPPPHYGETELAPEMLQSFLTRMGLMTLTVTLVCDSLVQEYRRRQFLSQVDAALAPPSAISASQVAGLHASIQESTDAAHEAFKEANSINTKISDLNARLLNEEGKHQ